MSFQTNVAANLKKDMGNNSLNLTFSLVVRLSFLDFDTLRKNIV